MLHVTIDTSKGHTLTVVYDPDSGDYRGYCSCGWAMQSTEYPQSVDDVRQDHDAE